ncbi:hypothetical protein ElyMa_003605700 [Elysia marginata]|uniref:Uncharacterized protein n=1 Tax=Elysia marginata TaxID=1093978 RepID=A0AAV4ER56_9GAST|nr:hypothetical protein ElyMa_003605700 [Elysia marginata]
MSKRTMSGSEMLAHSRNRHEQKNLRERLEALSHSEFLVRDNSRVESHRWRQFLIENHRSTGWSPMAMKPEISLEEEDACADTNEQSGSSPRRRYDLQAIKKYQRPWACTLRTGESYNKVYRELAEAGESSQKALYTPRQATLALLGAATFARGRTFSKHPRLAQTVPAVVGIERAKSAWVPGGRCQQPQGDNNDKLINARSVLKSAPVSRKQQQQQQLDTLTELDSQVKADLETASSSSKLAKAWLGSGRLKNRQVVDDTGSPNRDSTSTGVKFHNRTKMSQSVLDLNRLRKSLDSWKCFLCGGDRHPLTKGGEDDNERDGNFKSNFYDASLALKGIQRAKTVLDGILYKDTVKGENIEPTNSQSQPENPSTERTPCTCQHSQPANPELRSTKPKVKLGKKHQQPTQRKTPKKKLQNSAKPKSEKNAPQGDVSSCPKTIALSRRHGVVGRPRGLFENRCISQDNGSIGHEELPVSKNELESVDKEEMTAVNDELSDILPATLKERKLQLAQSVSGETLYKQNCAPLQSSSGLRMSTVQEEETKKIQDEVFNDTTEEPTLELAASAGSKTVRERYGLEAPLRSLSEEDNGELSPRSLVDDVFVNTDQREGANCTSINQMGPDETLPEESKVMAGQEESHPEINNVRQDERLELRDTFDAYAVGKSKTRHLSTVKRRKFSFVSAAVSAFVKNPSSDDLHNNARPTRYRSYSVTSQASIDSVGTSVDGSDNQRGRKNSKWQLENIICASSLARYAGRATRNEKGEICYTRPWRQKKKKVSKMGVNVFYAIARYMLQKQLDYRKEKETQKKLLDEKVSSVPVSKKNSEVKKLSTCHEDVSPVVVENTYDEPLKKDNNRKSTLGSFSPSTTLSRNISSEVPTLQSSSQCKSPEGVVAQRMAKKSQSKASNSTSGPNQRGSINKGKGKTRERTGSSVASSLDPNDIPNLASIIDPSKTPINLTNGVLDYDDDLSTITSGLMLLPGRKQVRYKGILLRNYVSPQDRYKIEPRMRYKKPTSIRWNSKEGAIVTAHSSSASESASKTVNVVFPKQARQRALAKMVEDNHSLPADHSARQANAELRAKIDQFLLSVEPYCVPRQKTALF